MVTSNNKLLCIYHGDCADGFAAATIVSMVYGNQVDFTAGIHGQPPPDEKGREVLIVDFSYLRPELIQLADKASSVHIIDHHHSAKNELVNLPTNVTLNIDTEQSGAVLTWKHFYPNQPVPALLKHIQDQDLLSFKIHNTRAIMASVFAIEHDFETWKKLLDSDVKDLIKDGKSILSYQAHNAKRIAKSCEMIDIAGYQVPVVNAPWFMSDQVCYMMINDAPFAACYYYKGGMIEFSLRGSKNFDVSIIAKLFGGGGGKKSAGFRFPASDLPQLNAI